MRLLDIRYFELKSDIHVVVDAVWKDLVQIDTEAGQVLIYDKLDSRKLPSCKEELRLTSPQTTHCPCLTLSSA